MEWGIIRYGCLIYNKPKEEEEFKMKKLVSVLLAAGIVASMTACGGDKKGVRSSTGRVQQPQQLRQQKQTKKRQKKLQKQLQKPPRI